MPIKHDFILLISSSLIMMEIKVLLKYKIVKKVACIWSHHLHLKWKFKSWAGKFAWTVKAKHHWALSTNFWNKKIVDITQQCLASSPQVNFHTNNLNFYWRWRDQIQAIFLNVFYFKLRQRLHNYSSLIKITSFHIFYCKNVCINKLGMLFNGFSLPLFQFVKLWHEHITWHI